MLFSKRNRSKRATKSIDTQQQHRQQYTEPVSKLSHIFSKFTNTITPHQRHVLKRPSMTHLVSFFKSDSQLDTLGKDSGFTKDMNFERRRYQQNMQTPRQPKDDGYATLYQKEHPEYDLSGSSLIGSQFPSMNHHISNNHNHVPSILIRRPSLTTSTSLDGASMYQPELNNRSKSNIDSISTKSKTDNKRININNKSTSTSTSGHSSDLHENGKSDASMKESPNLTTHSGDLTARQFANIAGIKILSEDEDNDDDDDTDDSNDSGWDGDGGGGSSSVNHRIGSSDGSMRDGQGTTLSNRSKAALLDQEKLSAGTASSIFTLNYSTTSNASSSNHKQQQQPQIWDSAFWNDNNNNNININNHLDSVVYSKALTQRKGSAPTERRHHHQYQTNGSHFHQHQQRQQLQCKPSSDGTILHELRRINTISNDHLTHHQQSHHRQTPLRRNRSYVIKKGRFEVSIETSDRTEIDTMPAQL
ncbi:hypothetical protein BCR42DRAFT_424269 [Absidia repens]|uniref:Uncharacterized protein n=1 Tax=Absidia repens TaxID=90262 RepID=A0A1X2I460_9FUNG|nr:hypothetical protein BCR42DRAFT_424269 [Absidia repens]